jgi:uncharacterized membrane protein
MEEQILAAAAAAAHTTIQIIKVELAVLGSWLSAIH